MKTYCKNLVIEKRMIVAAYQKWLTAQSGHKNAWRVLEEYGCAQSLIDEIYSEISSRSLTFKSIHRYRYIEKTNGKERLIGVESVKQQVVDYLAIDCLEQFLKAKIGFYQVASIKGKGQLFAAKTAQKWVKQNPSTYWVHLDIRKCYPSIKPDLVMAILRKYVRSDDVLYVCKSLLSTYSNELEIGSYFSLRISQLVLSFGYHYLENLAFERRGRRLPLLDHQLWYADDVFLLSRNKRALKQAAKKLTEFFTQHFSLQIKDWKVCRLPNEPIDVVGFRIGQDSITLRSSIFLRARRAFLQFEKQPTLEAAYRVCSYWGWLKNSDTFLFQQKIDAQRIFNSARRLISERN